MEHRSEENLNQLWQRYTKAGDRSAREELILHYANLVQYVVGRLSVVLPPSLQSGDLIGYGVIGLIEAVDRYNPDYGVKFSSFAIPRIRGHIIDALRTMDLKPRSVYRMRRQVEQAINRLYQTLGRAPSDMEIAAYLGITEKQYRHWLQQANITFISLDQTISYDDGTDTPFYEALEDDSLLRPAQKLENDELRTRLLEALQHLPEREQLLLSLYYNEGLTMKEIGHVMEVSESRVSQLHARAILTLRALLGLSEKRAARHTGQKAHIGKHYPSAAVVGV